MQQVQENTKKQALIEALQITVHSGDTESKEVVRAGEARPHSPTTGPCTPALTMENLPRVLHAGPSSQAAPQSPSPLNASCVVEEGEAVVRDPNAPPESTGVSP